MEIWWTQRVFGASQIPQVWTHRKVWTKNDCRPHLVWTFQGCPANLKSLQVLEWHTTVQEARNMPLAFLPSKFLKWVLKQYSFTSRLFIKCKNKTKQYSALVCPVFTREITVKISSSGIIKRTETAFTICTKWKGSHLKRWWSV